MAVKPKIVNLFFIKPSKTDKIKSVQRFSMLKACSSYVKVYISYIQHHNKPKQVPTHHQQVIKNIPNIIIFCVLASIACMHCIALHCIALHRIALHCIALHPQTTMGHTSAQIIRYFEIVVWHMFLTNFLMYPAARIWLKCCFVCASLLSTHPRTLGA